MIDHRVLILGARRRKQGLGEFIARYAHEAGAAVCGIVGTTENSVRETEQYLKVQYGIDTRGFTDIATAIAASQPTLVVIASPTDVHREHLEAVAKAGVACLCEKPLFWEDGSWPETSEVERLVDRFCDRGALLQLVTQWPETLDEYYTLYPEMKGQAVEGFQMLLGPTAAGINMAVDSLPHVLSMVHCMAGIGGVSNPRADYPDPDHLNVFFDYRHAGGLMQVEVNLIRSPDSPRPAGYSINGRAVKRSIQLPEYQIMFADESGNQIALEDPLRKLVRHTLEDVTGGKSADRAQLIASMTDLKALVENLQI